MTKTGRRRGRQVRLQLVRPITEDSEATAVMGKGPPENKRRHEGESQKKQNCVMRTGEWSMQ